MNAAFKSTRPRRISLPLPVSTALALGLMLGWAALLLRPEGVRVANHSAEVLHGVTVCGSSGPCFVRDHLRPHEAWTVPLHGAPEACLDLDFAERGVRGQACTPVARGEAVRLVVKSGGRVQVE